MSWLTLALLALLGCKKQEVAECVYDTDCGEESICQDDGTCRAVECLDSIECDLGSYCSEDYLCKEGCDDDSDCDAGEVCDDNECEEYGCRSTELDCPMGTYCDEGDCVDDTRGHCGTCDAIDSPGCGNNRDCFIWDVADRCNNDNDCAPGWSCDLISAGNVTERICHRDWCLVQCNPNAELQCPAGMACSDFGGGDFYCSGDCSYMVDNGFL